MTTSDVFICAALMHAKRKIILLQAAEMDGTSSADFMSWRILMCGIEH
jgi:hypothetical protein